MLVRREDIAALMFIRSARAVFRIFLSLIQNWHQMNCTII